MIINLEDISIGQRQSFLQHAVAPRPVALASTIDKEGNVNLSPFSFFNMFSVNPPVVIFSPSRRVRDNTTKHTLENLREVPEVVINIVTHDIVQQTSLASCEYGNGVDEFIKAGFTKEEASHVKPPMVKESKVKLECKVKEIIPLGEGNGAGNLVICEVLCMHVDDDVLNEEKTGIDQTKIHHAARLGGDWYCKVDSRNLFRVAKPNTKLGIGFDNLPSDILRSRILTGNHLAQLANEEQIPAINEEFNNMAMLFFIKQFKHNDEKRNGELHKLAAELLNNGLVADAWQVLLRTNSQPLKGSYEKCNDVLAPLQGLG